MGQMSKTEAENERRRAPRHAVDLPATVTFAGRKVACRLANISRTGALIGAADGLAIGTRVEIDLPGNGPVEANVVRVSGNHAALMFPGVVVLAPLLAA